MAYLIMYYQGNAEVAAAVLGVRRGTVERHAKGSLLPPRRALRERLREKTLDALCPIRGEEAAKRNASRRGRRRVRAVGAVRCVRYSVASVPLRR